MTESFRAVSLELQGSWLRLNQGGIPIIGSGVLQQDWNRPKATTSLQVYVEACGTAKEARFNALATPS
jgi:hypothetical protein